jgi:hypothetical protein
VALLHDVELEGAGLFVEIGRREVQREMTSDNLRETSLASLTVDYDVS